MQKLYLRVLLHHFFARTKDSPYFCVQLKQDKRTNRKVFMSVFDRGLFIAPPATGISASQNQLRLGL